MKHIELVGGPGDGVMLALRYTGQQAYPYHWRRTPASKLKVAVYLQANFLTTSGRVAFVPRVPFVTREGIVL